MTMLTGYHPEIHGVDEPHTKLSPQLPTLAERLHDAGYVTMGVGCGPWLGRPFGFPRGFDDYGALNLRLVMATRVRTRVAHALRTTPSDGKARFLFAHFYDPHGDWMRDGNKLSYYSPPEDHDDLEIPDATVCDEGGRCAIERIMAVGSRARRVFTDEQIELHHELYRRGVRYLDRELEGFFGELRSAGLWDDALVIVTADHGEEFAEHGKFAHSQIYRESLWIPLLVKLPRGERGGERVSRPVALEDIAPTLLRFAGVEFGPDLLGFDLLSPPRRRSERPLLSRESRRSGKTALRLGPWMLVRGRSGIALEVYDTGRDPGERSPIADPVAAQVGELSKRFDTVLRALAARRKVRSAPGEGLDASDEADLRALGYLQ